MEKYDWIEKYELPLHLRIISLWVNQDKVESWLEIENVFCKPFCLINLLDK